jgi:hypothetical protein
MSREYRPIDSIKGEEFENVWHFVTEIGLNERHFNQLQSSYRTLASQWLLAAFAGIGFVISSNFGGKYWRHSVMEFGFDGLSAIADCLL